MNLLGRHRICLSDDGENGRQRKIAPPAAAKNQNLWKRDLNVSQSSQGRLPEPREDRDGGRLV